MLLENSMWVLVKEEPFVSISRSLSPEGVLQYQTASLKTVLDNLKKKKQIYRSSSSRTSAGLLTYKV
jgi:hypothetical protein